MPEKGSQPVHDASAGARHPSGAAPDLTAGEAATPALPLVFVREGWSPALYARLARRGIAVIARHKGFWGSNPWPKEETRTIRAPLNGPGAGDAGIAGAARRTQPNARGLPRIRPANGLRTAV